MPMPIKCPQPFLPAPWGKMKMKRVVVDANYNNKGRSRGRWHRKWEEKVNKTNMLEMWLFPRGKIGGVFFSSLLGEGWKCQSGCCQHLEAMIGGMHTGLPDQTSKIFAKISQTYFISTQLTKTNTWWDDLYDDLNALTFECKICLIP